MVQNIERIVFEFKKDWNLFKTMLLKKGLLLNKKKYYSLSHKHRGKNKSYGEYNKLIDDETGLL